MVIERFESASIGHVFQDALAYALISKPFTLNRMKLPMRQCVMNIAKGKFAESLFLHMCRTRGMSIDVDACSTPFWDRDRRDFVLRGYEWDVKCIFLHADVADGEFLDCPALIPNRWHGDQWGSRNTRYVDSASNGPASVFAFMPPTNFRLELSNDQVAFLDQLCRRYREAPQVSEPFTIDWFRNHFPNYSSVSFTTIEPPRLAVTGFASAEHWNLFRELRPGPIRVAGRTVFTTKITNMYCRSGDLPQFFD